MGSGGLWARMPARALVLVALIAWPTAPGAQSQPSRDARVQVAWTKDWTATDIVVEKGETLSISIEVVETRQNPANGESPELVQAQLAADGLLYRIVGRIGDGPAFPVGRKFSQVATSGGPLSLRWDAPPEVGWTVKSFSIAVRVEPPSPPPPPDPDPDLENDQDAEGNLVADGNEASDRPIESGNEVAVKRTPGRAAETPVAATRREEPARPWYSQSLVFGGAALLLLLAAAASLPRWRRRRTLNRTRALLSLSPSLDLAEGACRGGSLPAEGPAASLRARLEPGAARMEEGGEHG
jgi:hypothetical protein